MINNNGPMSDEQKDIVYKSLDEVTFDLENPRIPLSIRQNEYDESAILKWMLERENVTDLMNSIGEKGFFPGEPILVVFEPTLSKYIAVEGNRRYTATLLLSYPEKAPVKKNVVNDIAFSASEHPKRIPVLEFNSRLEILDYLGYRHITGTEPWDSLAKARYLQLLYSRQDDSLSSIEKYRSLARQIGSNVSYVRQLLIGHELYEQIESRDFFQIPGLNDTTFEFGTFYTAVVKQNISLFIGVDIHSESPFANLNVSNLKELTKWMFEKNSEGQTRLGESRNISRLERILDPQYPKALEEFRKGASLVSASELTNEADDIVTKKLNDAEEALRIAYDFFPRILDPRNISRERILSIGRYLRSIDQLRQSKIDADGELNLFE